MNEMDRIPVEELHDHPFIAEQLLTSPLTALDIESFHTEMENSNANKHVSGLSLTSQSQMTHRFDENEVKETDVILTTKASEQVRILLG